MSLPSNVRFEAVEAFAGSAGSTTVDHVLLVSSRLALTAGSYSLSTSQSPARSTQQVRREKGRLISMAAKGLAEPEDAGPQTTALGREGRAPGTRLAETEQASTVAVPPDAIKAYLAAVEQLETTLADKEATPEGRLFHELDHVVAHADGGYEIKGRLAGSWAPRPWVSWV